MSVKYYTTDEIEAMFARWRIEANQGEGEDFGLTEYSVVREYDSEVW
jgi:hypothetical protein